MRERVHDPVTVARLFLFVRETLGPNRGVWVEAFQRIGDGKPGDSWCMDFVSAILWICYQGAPPLPRTGACDVAWAMAVDRGYEVDTPTPGDVVFWVKPDGDAHHVAVVTVGTDAPTGFDFRAIGGNTSEDGLSSNGTGVFENWIARKPHHRFVRLPVAA